MFGETDRVIEREMSEELLQHFHQPELLRHPGGHFVPATGSTKHGFTQFLDRMLATLQ